MATERYCKPEDKSLSGLNNTEAVLMQDFILHVNGDIHQVRVDPETPLLYVLRNDLGLKGSKLGCGSEQCGACKVIVDGQAVPSCKLPVKNLQGLEITTVEGLGKTNDLHPLQLAFIEEQAVQCGYCTSGMIMAARALLIRRRYPTDGEIREALADNLCRCGVYHRVLRAIKLATGRPTPSPIYELVDGDGKSRTTSPSADLPYTLQNTPDLDSWIRINTDGTITIFTGKVDFGQGIKTAFAQIAAEELDVSIEKIRVIMGDTAQTPDEGLTVGSMSMQTSGNAIRYAAAEARLILLSIAFEVLEAPLNRLVVNDGVITDPTSGRSVSYWDLFGGSKFARSVVGLGTPKSAEAYQLVGNTAQRLDLMEKVTGKASFIQDLDLPGMVHGRVVRPPNYRARLVSVDEDAACRLPGVLKVVRDGSFLAVIATREEQAVSASEALRESASWEGGPELPAQEKIFEEMQEHPVQSYLVVKGTPVNDPIPPSKIPRDAAHTLNATYCRPYHMHASPGPSAAVAHLDGDKLTLWTHAQGVYSPRSTVAHVLNMAEKDIRVIFIEGSGCYGHNGADDAALDAALLARSFPGKPVSLKWTREDENTWEPYGTSMVIKMRASLDGEGELLDWNHEVWSYPHIGRPRAGEGVSGLIAAWHLEKPFNPPVLQPGMWNHGGSHRNAEPLYNFPRQRIVKHALLDSQLRVSSLRSLGAYANVFALESFVDELAHQAGVDPIEFRLRYLTDERARSVLEAAAEKADWNRKRGLGRDGIGRGVAFARYKNNACYAAVILDVSVDRETGAIRLHRAVISADAGQIVNPDGLSSQLEGGFTQAASWTLMEQVTFDSHGITSVDWDSYPILRFPDIPAIETALINRPGEPYLGSGEATQGPTPAAIANAVYDAIGVRLRTIPFLPERVLEGMRGR
jgi:CO/xanthine dehydrogenase Mo-binding subunit/aerobic-type carbon monoxide dehydrogenase small subunit (CoxS/CutS family)